MLQIERFALKTHISSLVVIARVKHKIPSRTRTWNPVAPMVLCQKAWESWSLPSLTCEFFIHISTKCGHILLNIAVHFLIFNSDLSKIALCKHRIVSHGACSQDISCPHKKHPQKKQKNPFDKKTKKSTNIEEAPCDLRAPSLMQEYELHLKLG